MKKGAASIPSQWGELGSQLFQDLDQLAIEDAINGPSERSPVFDNFSISPIMGKKARAHIGLMTDMRRMLSKLSWTDCQPALLPDDLNIKPPAIDTEQTAAQWRSIVTNKCMEILEEWAQHLPPSTSSGTGTGSFIPNDVCVVDKSYMSHSFFSKEWQEAIETISTQFELNKEQDCAFHIVANHACSPDSEQLKMNIAGMAGTGKTQVLKALVEFFEFHKESHHFVIVAPTRSAAALLKDSTYHSMFRINSDGKKTSNIQLAQV